MKLSKSKIPQNLMRSGKKVKSWKNAIAVGAISASLGLGFWASKAFYTVKEVVDGDTFITTENRYIRFDKVDAPEIDSCLGVEAKNKLSELILGKKVFIKVTYKEPKRGRLVASVYSEKGNIQEQMLKSGFGTLSGGFKQNDLNIASDYARDSKIGIYSPTCTQTVNLENPKCNIKGNVSRDNKLYRYPGCDQYNPTIIQLYQGDKWFCTEKEAKNAGFTIGSDCF